MPEYRVYYVGEGDRFVGRKDVTCPSDEAALEHAKQLADGYGVELWEGKRFIARIDGQDKSTPS